MFHITHLLSFNTDFFPINRRRAGGFLILSVVLIRSASINHDEKFLSELKELLANVEMEGNESHNSSGSFGMRTAF